MRFVVAIICGLGLAPIAAQQPAAQLRFDVASVRQHRERVDPLSGGRRGGLCMGSDSAVVPTAGFTLGPNGVVSTTTTTAPIHSPGTCSFARTTLDEIIAAAYAIPRRDLDRVIVGGPSWIREDRFDLEGRADRPRSQAELEQMLQALLAERFGLRVRREIRNVDGFALQTVDGRHKLQAADDSAATGTRWTAGTVAATAVPIGQFAMLLNRGLAKPVVDQTGLTGRYTFTLTWMPADGEAFVPRGFPAVSATPQPSRDGSGPSLFTALQEQLGLRLRPQQVPIEVLVIDAVNHPTPN